MTVNVLLLSAGAVKDSAKVHVEKNIGQVVGYAVIQCKPATVQFVHDLIEQRIILLLCLGADFTFLRGSMIQLKSIVPP